MQMFGAITKTYFAEKIGVDPREDLQRCHHAVHRQKGGKATDTIFDRTRKRGMQDVDIVLTTREMDRLMRIAEHQCHSACRRQSLTLRSASAPVPASSSARPAA